MVSRVDAAWWASPRGLRRQVVALVLAGSNPAVHPTHDPQHRGDGYIHMVTLRSGVLLVLTALIALLAGLAVAACDSSDDEERLAAQRGVSRTPVREALVRLAELDLVQPTDGRKFQVAPLSLQDVDELFEFREALEPLAATASSDADLETLQAIVDQMRANLAAGDVDAFYGERPVSKTTQDLDQRSGRWQASRWAILDHLQKTHGQLKTYLTNWRRIQAAAGRRGGTLSSFEAAGTEIGAGPRDGTLHAYA